MVRSTTTCKCSTKEQGKPVSSFLPVAGGVLLAILPKCPFCVLAYSSALSLCGSTQVHHPAWASWISIVFAFLTLSLVLFNYKGKRTFFAASIVSLGCALIVWAELNTGSLVSYYWGTSLVMIGVWLNASLMHFLRKGIQAIQKTIRKRNISAFSEAGDV